MVGQHPQQHHGAGHRQGQAKDDAGGPGPAKRAGQHGPQHRRDQALDDGPGQGNTPHGQQFFEVEVQPHAEHQQDDPDLGQLFRQLLVGDKARRVGTDGNAAQEIPDEGRQPEPLRQISKARAAVRPPVRVRIKSM